MDFVLDDAQQAVVESAAAILAGAASGPDHDLGAFESARAAGIDRDLWETLAGANLLGLAVAGEDGGSDLGVFEVYLLLEQAGRAAAVAPLWPTLVLAGLPLARFATAAQRERWLRPLAAGHLIGTAALVEVGADPATPTADATTVARRHDAGWVLDGVRTCVPAGMLADVILVPARLPEDGGGDGGRGVGVFVVPADAAGVSRTPLVTTTGVAEARVELAGVEVDDQARLGDDPTATAVLDWLWPRATVGLCALMSGTCQAALDLTAAYVASREQFGHPIAAFQAVGQRAGDAYIDTEGVRLTGLHAAWRLGAGLAADEEVAVAKYWAAEAGQRVVHAATHLHGGMGVDRTYPLHRYFLAAKQLELTLGGTTPSLLRLGAMLAAQPA